MTVLACDFRSIVGDRAQGTVTIESVVDRPAHGIPGAVVLPVRETYRLVDGQCAIENIDPGPVAVEVSAGGVFRRWEINIPEDGRHQFSEMLERQVQWSPAVVSRVETLVAEATRNAAAAGRSASAAKQAEARVAAVVADAVGVLRVDVAESLAAVGGARDEAVAARDKAVEARGGAEAARDSAEGFCDEAQAARDEAQGRAASASEKSTLAGEHASTAQSWAEKSEAARQAGVALIVEGRSLAEQGAADADRAEAARTEAEGYARTSGEQATVAEQHAREAAASAESAKQGAPEGGWTKSQLHVNVQAQLDKVDGLPTAQTVQSMIAGKADTTMVQQGLSGKMDVQPVSENATQSTLVKRTAQGRIKAATGTAVDDVVTKSQIDGKLDRSTQNWALYGRDGSDETMVPYSADAEAYKLAMRTRGGSLYVGPPVADDHAATKQYVDSAVKSSSSKYLLLEYANSSEMALPRTTAKAIPWVTESGTITHQHTSGADCGVLIREPGVYQITANFPYIDYYSDKVSYELQTGPIGGSYSTAKFALMESSIAWDRSDSMSWPLTLASQMWIRLLVTCNNGTAGGWNRNKRIKADMLLTKIA